MTVSYRHQTKVTRAQHVKPGDHIIRPHRKGGRPLFWTVTDIRQNGRGNAYEALTICATAGALTTTWTLPKGYTLSKVVEPDVVQDKA